VQEGGSVTLQHDRPANLASASLALMPGPAAPGHARRWLRDVLAGSGVSDDTHYAVELIVDELVTNATLHAGSPIRVQVDRLDARYRCLVHDECADGPYPRIIETADGYGRGLRLVALLSVAWGVERNEDGTSVWAEIDS
jgi:anti-sigma regulatory factor (Ser/Thr protein kinase)